MRQLCLECILNFEGFAKTEGFLLRRDLHLKEHSNTNTSSKHSPVTEKNNCNEYWMLQKKAASAVIIQPSVKWMVLEQLQKSGFCCFQTVVVGKANMLYTELSDNV